MASSLLGRRVEWAAGRRRLRGVVVYDGDPLPDWVAIFSAGAAAPPLAEAAAAPSAAWGRHRPASASGLVVRAEEERCWECDGTGRVWEPLYSAPAGNGWQCGACIQSPGWLPLPAGGRIYYAPRREAIQGVACPSS